MVNTSTSERADASSTVDTKDNDYTIRKLPLFMRMNKQSTRYDPDIWDLNVTVHALSETNLVSSTVSVLECMTTSLPLLLRESACGFNLTTKN